MFMKTVCISFFLNSRLRYFCTRFLATLLTIRCVFVKQVNTIQWDFCHLCDWDSTMFLALQCLYTNIPPPQYFLHHHLPSDRLNHPNCDLSSDNLLIYLQCLPNICRRSCGKVMFSVVRVCLFTGVCHVTITHDALNCIIPGPPKPWPRPPNMGPYCTGNPPSSLTLPDSADIWWLIKQVK